MDTKEAAHQRRQFWQTHLEQWRHSDISGQQYCRDHELSYHRFNYWRRNLLNASATSSPGKQTSGFTQVVRRDEYNAGLVMSLPNGISFRGITEDHIGLISQLLRQL